MEKEEEEGKIKKKEISGIKNPRFEEGITQEATIEKIEDDERATEQDGAIKIKNLSKSYGKLKVLDNISLTVPYNSIYGLLGSNGAGKSTFMHILTGLLDYDSGELFILREDVNGRSKSVQRKLAIVPQKLSLYNDLTIYDNLFFFGKSYGMKSREVKGKINELAGILGLGDLNRRIKHLSGGYKRRVSIAVSLIGGPEILILDEALVGIDIETREIIINLLLELKKEKTIIITTHSIREAERLCDHMCFLHRGKKLVEGETREIIRKNSSDKEIIIEMKADNIKRAKDVIKKLKDFKVKKQIQGRNITLSFLSADYNLLEVIDYIKNIIGNVYFIEDLQIKAPGLEEVVKDLIKT